MIDRAHAIADELGMTHLARRIEAARADLPSATAAHRPRPPDAIPALVREGDVWSIAYRDRSIRLRHSRALEILDRLIKEPGKELHVLELGGTSEPIDTGDAGEVIDAEAKAAYKRRIRELEEELAQAEAWADAGRRERLRAELEFLKEELARSVGLGGKPRRTAGAVERARTNVTKRLKGVIKKIGELDAELGEHLESSVKTGIYVSYRPSHVP